MTIKELTKEEVNKAILSLEKKINTTQTKESAEPVKQTTNTSANNSSSSVISDDTKMNKTNPKGKGSFSLNRKANTTVGSYSTAEGYNTQSRAQASHAEGFETIAGGKSSHAEGTKTIANSDNMHAAGKFNKTTSGVARVTGWGTAENKKDIETLDTSGNLYVSGNVYSEGYKKLATLEDLESKADKEDLDSKLDKENPAGTGSLSLNRRENTTVGDYSTAEGNDTTASGSSSHAEGHSTFATGHASHTEGYGTKASGEQSHAEGCETTASGNYSHAEGITTTSSGYNSHAEGRSSTSSGYNSHAEGHSSTASGNASHAEGYSSTASGSYSHAEGCGTIANYDNMHAAGKYNLTTTDAARVTGWGTSSEKKDIEVLDTSGNLKIAGKFYSDNKEVLLKTDVDETLSTSSSNPIANKTIADLIPSSTTSENQLADKNFVNSSIATETAYFKGTFNSVEELPTTDVTNNDYAFIKVMDETTGLVKQYDRYKYVSSSQSWVYEYTLNNSSFTSDQWNAINSGITDTLVGKLDGIQPGAQKNVQSDWSQTDTTADDYIKNKPDFLQVQSDWNQNDDTAADYIKNKPTIPILPNSLNVITISKSSSGSTTVNFNSFTSNGLYRPDGDMNSWGTVSWLNAPTSTRPDGGFALLVFEEGNYKRQILTLYNDKRVYERYTHYNSGVQWSDWKTVALTEDILSYLSLTGGTMTGAIVTAQGVNGNDLRGIQLKDAGSLTSLESDVLLLGHRAFRFSDVTTWDYDKWAGLKYSSSEKAIKLGIADNSVFTANNAQNGGKLSLPGVDAFYSPKIIVNSNGNAITNSWNEGIRLNRANNEWATIAIGGSSGTQYGTDDSTWAICAAPVNNSTNPNELVFNRNGSSSDYCASFYKGSSTDIGLKTRLGVNNRNGFHHQAISSKNTFYNAAGRYIQIRFNDAWTNNMMSFRVRVCEYDSGKMADLLIYGYAYNGNSRWYNCKAFAQTNSDIRVWWGAGNDGVATVLIKWESCGVDNYPQIDIYDISCGYLNSSYDTSKISIELTDSINWGRSDTSMIALSYASSATKDGNDNVITDTYATKNEANRYVAYTGTGNNCLTAYQTNGSFQGNSGWASYIICNHHDGASYYNQTIRMPFWSAPQYQRMEGGKLTGWKNFVTDENIDSYLSNIKLKVSIGRPSSITAGDIWIE